jgi:hypothetical protein
MSDLKVSQLRAKCKELSIKGYSKLRKAELVELLFPKVLGECCVCYNKKPLRRTNCNHEFCNECWDKWFVQSRKIHCPYCRAVCIQQTVPQVNENNDDEELQIQELLMNYFRRS